MAQLVARLVRNEKVGGSNPPSSTTGRHPIADVGFLYAWVRWCGACRCVACGAAGVPGAPLCCFVGPCRCVCRWVAARPRDRHTRACGSEWSLSRPALALPPPTGALRRPPHRRRLVADVWLGASACCPARPCHRPLAPRPASHVKPSSPLLACAPSPVKPTTPLQARYPRFRRNFGEQRRHGFHGGVLRLPHWC